MLAALLPLATFSPLDDILDDPKISGAVVSCTVAAEAGEVIYERNSALRVMPASNQKLLTNAYALYRLGPNYQPETRIWKMSNKVVVESKGDPMMTSERLRKAADMLNLNKRTPVYLSQAYRPLIPPSWEWDDLPNKYAAPISAFTVDRGSIELWAEGERLTILPYNYGLAPVRGSRSGSRIVLYDPMRRTMIVSGDLPKAKTKIDTLALPYPDVAAASFLGSGLYFTSSVPTYAPSLVLGGPPIKDVIKECLVKSDNHLAENLLLMAAAREKPLGKNPYDDAEERLGAFLTKVVGAEKNDFRPQDGSGMSRHDLVTTRGIVKLLQWSLERSTKDVWLDALAKPGSGTLSTRLEGVSFVGKTGTLDMVVALSGYVKTKKGRLLTVSLILNHFVCGEKDARAIADEFIKKLAEDDSFGMVSASSRVHEARSSNPYAYALDAGGHLRLSFDRLDARQRDDRRAEPAHAGVHRAQ